MGLLKFNKRLSVCLQNRNNIVAINSSLTDPLMEANG